MKAIRFLSTLCIMLGLVFPIQANASSNAEGKFDLGGMILHHVQDEYSIHFFEIGDFHATVPLPIIAYVPGEGIKMFSSSHLMHLDSASTYNGFVIDHHLVYADLDANGNLQRDEAGHIKSKKIYDFSITKNVAAMIFSIALMCMLFISVASAYKKTIGKAPKGLQSFMEPIIVFVRDDIAKVNLGHKAGRFLPFLLTVFFVIWINNILGLITFMGGLNVTGNISVTLVLAMCTFLITNLNGNKAYWGHVFSPPGVPAFLLPIMWVVEILGLFTKPFALAVRLFANITAGHMIILALAGMIFTMSNGGTNLGAGFGMGTVSLLFSIFMFCLELLVAAIQAFIFTTLSAVFISQAVEDHHEHH